MPIAPQRVVRPATVRPPDGTEDREGPSPAALPARAALAAGARIVPMVTDRTMPNGPIMWGNELTWPEVEMLGRFFYSPYFANHDRWEEVPLEEQRRLQSDAHQEVEAYLRGLPNHPLHRWIPWLLAKEGCKPGAAPGMVPVMYPDECVARWNWTVQSGRAIARHAQRRRCGPDYLSDEDDFPDSDSDDWDDARPRRARRRTTRDFSPSPDKEGKQFGPNPDKQQGNRSQLPTEHPLSQQAAAMEEDDKPSPVTEVILSSQKAQVVTDSSSSSGMETKAFQPSGGGGVSPKLSQTLTADSTIEVSNNNIELEISPDNSRFHTESNQGEAIQWPPEAFINSHLNNRSSPLTANWTVRKGSP